MEQRPGIGIVNAHWLLHSSVAYLAHSLEHAGYNVHVFLYRSDENLSGDLLRETSFIKVHRLAVNPDESERRGGIEATGPANGKQKTSLTLFQLAKAIVPRSVKFQLRKLQRYLPLKWDSAIATLIPEEIVRNIVETCLGNRVSILVGVEKGGLGLAGAAAQQTGIPSAYYSLELYTWNHPWVMSSIEMMKFKCIEEHYHSRCALTIVQDEYRGRALLTDNRVSSLMPTAYLPISLSGPPNREPYRWLQSELGLSDDTVIVLSFGMMNKQRLCRELAGAAQAFPPNWRLVFHGYGAAEIIREIQDADVRQRVSISQRLIPANDREIVLRSATIGLAMYRGEPLNDRLTGLSSEKIAMYFKCGLPIIAFRYLTYEHIEAEGAGVLVESIDDIPGAVKKILEDYEIYAKNAYRCYRKHYCFEDNFGNVLISLKEISR